MSLASLHSFRTQIRDRIESGTLRPVEINESQQMETGSRVVYLMRGLPSCGKSTTAQKLAGKEGVVIETDAFFQQPGQGPSGYSFDRTRIGEAREWTLDLFRQAISSEVPKIVIDRGNGSNRESKVYADIALEHGYDLQLKEPESSWWQEIKVLLRYRPTTDGLLDDWAKELARLSRRTHRVDFETIRHWMDSWVDDLTVEDILAV